MRKGLILASLLILSCASPAVAQERKATRHVAVGYVYNVKEDDGGIWTEGGFKVARRAEVAVAYTRFADYYRFQEVSAVLRAPLFRVGRVRFGPEAGYAMGSYTNTPQTQEGGATWTWVAGAATEFRVGKRWSWLSRFDLVNPHTGASKVDRFRIHSGLKFSF